MRLLRYDNNLQNAVKLLRTNLPFIIVKLFAPLRAVQKTKMALKLI